MSIPFQATHTADDGRYYMVDECEWFYANHMGHWKRHWSGAPAGLKELAKKPWSGPEDRFPPVNSVCEFVSSDTSWGKVKIIAHDEGKVVFKPSGDSYYGVTPDHKAVFRPLIDTEQKRESAIRELMDIAQVDCRVTAARLVDAGFKQEVV